MKAFFQSPVPTDYLRDESRTCGAADAIAFPRNATELSVAVREAGTRGLSVTVQGARTGISAGAVPDGGVVVNLSKMERILGLRVDAAGRAILCAQPGVPLIALRRYLSSDSRSTSAEPFPASTFGLRHPPPRLFFPPDPTETSASLGGMAACNASGACSFAYGPTRDHIAGLTVVLADGGTLTLRRGQAFARGRSFSLTADNGKTYAGELPSYTLPTVKNAAGYWVKPGMDLIDLFIGSEGTLGIVAELELRLTPRPYKTLGALCYAESEETALKLVAELRQRARETHPHALVALEYFDEGALRLIRAGAPSTGLLLPPPKPHWRCALYAEWALRSDDGAPEPLLCELLEACGGSPDDTWVAADAPALEKLKTFRHAVPEQVNAVIAERKRRFPELTKLGTDFSVPDDKLGDAMALYRRDLRSANLEHVIFGHIGNDHVHVNILPRDRDDYAKGKALYRAWAQQVVDWGGSVSAEHGIGRLKKELLAVMYGAEGIAAMRKLKAVFDPASRLNPGRLF